VYRVHSPKSSFPVDSFCIWAVAANPAAVKAFRRVASCSGPADASHHSGASGAEGATDSSPPERCNPSGSVAVPSTTTQPRSPHPRRCSRWSTRSRSQRCGSRASRGRSCRRGCRSQGPKIEPPRLESRRGGSFKNDPGLLAGLCRIRRSSCRRSLRSSARGVAARWRTGLADRRRPRGRRAAVVLSPTADEKDSQCRRSRQQKDPSYSHASPKAWL
jgi:hypothetical protein